VICNDQEALHQDLREPFIHVGQNLFASFTRVVVVNMVDSWLTEGLVLQWSILGESAHQAIQKSILKPILEISSDSES
jgi:hypothetical protein